MTKLVNLELTLTSIIIFNAKNSGKLTAKFNAIDNKEKYFRVICAQEGQVELLKNINKGTKLIITIGADYQIKTDNWESKDGKKNETSIVEFPKYISIKK